MLDQGGFDYCGIEMSLDTTFASGLFYFNEWMSLRVKIPHKSNENKPCTSQDAQGLY